MKKTYFAILAMLCISLFAVQAADWYPTTVVKVDPDAGGIPPSTGNGALRTAVSATAAPAIYELKRGGVYYVNGTCAFGTNAVILRAEAGEGPRPIIIPYTLTGTSNDVLSSATNIRLENIYIYGQEYGTTAPTRRGVIRITGGENFEFENVTFDGSSSAALMRFENLNASNANPFLAIINKCTFRNAVDYTNITNARSIDMRDSKGISLRISNSTFYSISAQIVRQGNTSMDEYSFINNTIYGMGPTFGLNVAEKVVVKNNIYYNPVLNGSTAAPGNTITVDALDNPDIPRDITIKHNLFYREPAFDALAPLSETRFLVSNILNSTGHDLANLTPAQLVISDTLSYAVEFKNPPATLFPFYKYTWENNITNTTIATEYHTYTRREAGADLKGDVMPADVQTYDFSYPNTSPAATAGEGGTYLGAWAPYDATSVKMVNAEEFIKYNFNSSAKSLNIAFNTPTPIVKVSVYTVAGVMISNSLLATNGLNTEIALPNLNRGVYLFTVEMGNKAASGKFVY